MHDITINQTADLATHITVDGVNLQHVLRYHVTQDGPLTPIALTVVTHDPYTPATPGVPRDPEVTTTYYVRSLTVTTGKSF
jgi:hypothetical protein